MRNLSEEEKSRIYKKIGVDESKLHPFGDANICVQLFGHEDEGSDDEYHVLNFMPRKEYCCDIELDVANKEGKNELEEILEDSIERMKIAAYLMGKQLEELRNEGKVKTTFYYWEL